MLKNNKDEIYEDVLHQWQESVKKVNELFGTNISVKPKEETKDPKEDDE